MDGEEDEPLNFCKTSLQVEDVSTSDRESLGELQNTDRKCESESVQEQKELPPVTDEGHGPLHEKDVGGVGAREGILAAKSDLEMGNKELVGTEIAKEKIIDKFLEDTIEEVDIKVEADVFDAASAGKRLVSDLANEKEVNGMVVVSVVKNTVDEVTLESQQEANEEIVADVAKETDGVCVANEPNEALLAGMTDLVKMEAVHMTNVAEETADVRGDVPGVAECLEKTVEYDDACEGEKTERADRAEAVQHLDAVGVINVAEETKTAVNGDVAAAAEETDETKESVVTEEGDVRRLTDIVDVPQDMEAIYVTNVAVELETDMRVNKDEPSMLEEMGLEKQESCVVKERDMTVPLQLVDQELYATNLVDESGDEDKTVYFGDEIAEAVDMINAADETADEEVKNVPEETAVEKMEYVADDAAKEEEMENLDEGTAEVEEMEYVSEETAEVEPEEIENAAEEETAGVKDMDKVDEVTAVAEEMDKVAKEIVGAEEMDNVANETPQAAKMVNVADDTFEAEEMNAYENDMVEETTVADEAEEMDLVDEVEEEIKGSSGGKRKRGKNSRAPARLPSRKKMEEDVCFICFDGGDLVLCDRRGCPKAYHPSCVNRDEAFFRAKGRWNCGWHLCSNCGKTAYYMCYTCTFSLCKGCIKDAVMHCVRGNKGFCEACMKTIMLIEKNEGQVDFNDKSSWEYLFKDYWTDLKGRLSLTFDELVQAKSPRKGSDTVTGKHESPDELYDANIGRESDSDSYENLEPNNSKRRKSKKRLKSRAKGRDSLDKSVTTSAEGLPSGSENTIEWGSKELLEFVMHMRSGDRSVLSQFDVQALLLEYIKRNKLRDPRRKSQIICDSRLQNLFGKPRVGHFEMLKLLESHFLVKEDSQGDDLQGSVVDTEASQLDGDTDLLKVGKDRKRKARKKSDGRGAQSNLDDYAAIDTHNINLIYLRRNLVEELVDDMENFHDKVVGSFVRIRILGSAQKQDLYRLVQVTGTCKAAEPYKVGKKMTDTVLEILNLDKTEIITSDIISNQEFTEDECKRLRQSIKCGLLNRLTVGDIQEKAIALQEVRVKDWLEAEIVRLSHLRDRASEKGRRKELRECVEKLQLLKTPEERQRRLEEIPEIHADPHMDPSHESEEDEESYSQPRGTALGRRPKEPISPRKGSSSVTDNWSGMRNFSSINRELSRSLSNKGFSNKAEDSTGGGEIVNENSWKKREADIQQSVSQDKEYLISGSEIGPRNSKSQLISEASSPGAPQNSAAPLSTSMTQDSPKVNEAEKMWHYQDPSGKVQGPFSMVQLRKWSNTGYFPAELKIWKTNEKKDEAVLLTDALVGKFQKDTSLAGGTFPKAEVVHNSHLQPSYSGKPHDVTSRQSLEGQLSSHTHSNVGSSGHCTVESWRSQDEISSSTGRAAPSSVDIPKPSADGWSSGYGSRNDPTNLPSPTPSSGVGGSKGPTTQRAASVLDTNPFSGGNGGLQPSALFTRESSLRHSENDSSIYSAPMPEKSMVLGSTNTAQIHSQSMVASPAMVVNASMNPSADIKSISANLQSLVQSVSNRSAAESQGWVSSSVSKQEINVEPNRSSMPGQPPQGHWGDSSAIHNSNSASPFSSANPSTNFPTPGLSSLPPSGPWRPPVPTNQSNIPTSVPTSLPWGMNAPDNQNTAWVPPPGNPNMGWGGPVPLNPQPSWVAPGQAAVPGNTNPGWAPPQGLGWVPYNQMPPPPNANPGWIAPGQGPTPGQGPPGNANPGWAPPAGNQGMWGNEQNNVGDRFSNQRERDRDRGSHGGGKPRNRQSSFNGDGGGGGSSRPPFKGQRVCKYHESGHCKKGASCDYLHT